MRINFAIVFVSILIAGFLPSKVDSGISLGSCSLSCNENEESSNEMIGESSMKRIVGSPGKAGPEGARGSPGPRGQKGDKGVCDCNSYQQLINTMNQLKTENEELQSNIYVKDCKEAKKTVSSSGVRVIYPFESRRNGIHVYCNQDIDDGGWIVIQRRVGGPVDFFRGWDEYVNGFGNKEADFWLGLETVHLLTSKGSYDLRIHLEDKAGNKVYAKYKSFKLGGADQNYKLYVGAYSGNAGDSLIKHNGMLFSTKDRDNDIYSKNCASDFKGAWWYNNCHSSNLNGIYGGTASKATGVSWYPWKNTHESLKNAEMKIRRINA